MNSYTLPTFIENERLVLKASRYPYFKASCEAQGIMTRETAYSYLTALPYDMFAPTIHESIIKLSRDGDNYDTYGLNYYYFNLIGGAIGMALHGLLMFRVLLLARRGIFDDEAYINTSNFLGFV